MNEILFILHGLCLAWFVSIVVRSERLAPIIVFSSISLFLVNFFFQEAHLFFYWTSSLGIYYLTAAMLTHLLVFEFRGYKQALQVLFNSFLFSIFILVMARLHLMYSPASCDATQWAYNNIFSDGLTIFASSITVFLIIQLGGIWLWSHLQTKKLHLWTRSLICMLTLQLVDTVLFTLFQPVPNPGLDLMLNSFLKKVIAFVVISPLIFYLSEYKTPKNVPFNI